MTHNLLYVQSNTTHTVLQQANTSDIDALSEYVLQYMAAGTYTGTLVANGSYVNIGTFTDTARVGAPGSSDITIVSNTYTVSQIQSTTLGASSDAPKYVGLNVTGANVELKEEMTTLSNLADEVIDRLVANGTNSYVLAQSAPGSGTWTIVGSLVDTLENFTVTAGTYNLYKRIDNGSAASPPVGGRPIKLSSGELVQFSNTEMQALVKTVEERMVATGKGFYALQSSTPVSGTWTNVGTITDTRRTVNEGSFDGAGFAATFQSNFTSQFSSTFESNYTTDYTADYTSTYSNEFTSNFTSDFAGIYTGDYTADYIGTFTSIYSSDFTFDFTTLYLSTYDGSFTGSFDGSGFINFRPADFTRSIYIGNYIGIAYTGNFTGAAFSSNFTGTFNSNFTGGVFSSNFAGTFTSNFSTPGITYTGNYLGGTATTQYTRRVPGPPGSEIITYIIYSGPPGNTGEIQFTGNFSSGGIVYTGNFTGATYTGDFTGATYTGNFTGITYTGNFTGTFSSNFTGDFTNNFTELYNTIFQSPTYTGTYVGPAFASNFTGPNYLGNFISPLYTGDFTSIFNSTFTGPTFTNNFSSPLYTGDFTSPLYANEFDSAVPFTNTFADTYTGTFISDYTADYTADYSGAVYTATYDGAVVAPPPTETVTSITLWRRIA